MPSHNSAKARGRSTGRRPWLSASFSRLSRVMPARIRPFRSGVTSSPDSVMTRKFIVPPSSTQLRVAESSHSTWVQPLRCASASAIMDAP